MWPSIKAFHDHFTYSQLHSPLILSCFLWRLRQLFFSLKLIPLAIICSNIDPDFAEKKHQVLLRMDSALWVVWNWVLRWTYSSFALSCRMDSVAITHTSPRPFLHFWKLVLIVSEVEFNLQFPSNVRCDSFEDKSGLNWVQVSLLWDRREV